jgi:hypothetical protein
VAQLHKRMTSAFRLEHEHVVVSRIEKRIKNDKAEERIRKVEEQRDLRLQAKKVEAEAKQEARKIAREQAEREKF